MAKVKGNSPEIKPTICCHFMCLKAHLPRHYGHLNLGIHARPLTFREPTPTCPCHSNVKKLESLLMMLNGCTVEATYKGRLYKGTL